eukprot:1189102-Prorocentrum_minimum.AAC.2
MSSPSAYSSEVLPGPSRERSSMASRWRPERKAPSAEDCVCAWTTHLGPHVGMWDGEQLETKDAAAADSGQATIGQMRRSSPLLLRLRRHQIGASHSRSVK